MLTQKLHSSIDILVVDDHESVLQGVKFFLKQNIENVYIKGVLDGKTTLQQIKGHKYDVYIIDLNLKDIEGYNLILAIREEHPDAKIIVYTMHEEIWYVKMLLELKINGVVLKSSPIYNLKYAIKKISEGESYYCPRFKQIKYEHNLLCSDSFLLATEISGIEIEIMQLIAESYTSAQISEITGYTKNTIMSYKKDLFRKFGVKSAPELIAKAMINGFPIRKKTKK
ncbi:response regulator transcription factor [Dysgonomonas sp. ZJ709]|uniref:response regulator transcription factor n=1 Tax=Dysgonomonas sp. ZJ709 TaxID=2709797 RepID=UPI0013EA383D|nr:response regulator transcription factor [Dysgonomonas sp. ZJ709]